jgi:hypothetical protein
MEHIRIKNTFKDFEHFCGVLTHKIFTLYNLTNELENIEYIDGQSDLGRRIFIMVGETEYMIRTWNVYDTDSNVFVDYTLFRQMENGEYETV